MSRRKPKPSPEPTPEPEPKVQSWWARRKERRRAEQPVDRAARITAMATGWMAAFTCVLMITSCGTVYIIWKQLGEMHTGGEDTHTLALATHDLAEQGKANFSADQRPYMFADAVLTDRNGKPILEGKPDFLAGRKVDWKIRYLNYGKTPAINFLNYGEVYFGENAMSKALFFMAHTPNPPARPPGQGTITPPTTTPVGYTDSLSDEEVSSTDLEFMKTHDPSSVLIGRLYYSDVHGNPYYTEYCKASYRNGATLDCPQFNDIH